MSDPNPEEVRTAPVLEPQTERKEKLEGLKPIGHVEKDFEENCDEPEEEEEVSVCAAMEPCTLPWPGDRKPQTDRDDGIWSEKCTSEPEDGDTGISAGSQDISEKQSREGEEEEEEKIGNVKAKWRESMPEGERWRSDEIQHNSDKGGGSMADDEEEEEEEEEDEKKWRAEKGVPGFTPRVTIVRMSSKELQEEEEKPLFQETRGYDEPYAEKCSAQYHEWPQQHDDKLLNGPVRAGSVCFCWRVNNRDWKCARTQHSAEKSVFSRRQPLLGILFVEGPGRPEPVITPEGNTAKPGDHVFIKTLKRKNWTSPRWEGPYRVILATPTAVKVEGKATWIHQSHCKLRNQLDLTDPGPASKTSQTQDAEISKTS